MGCGMKLVLSKRKRKKGTIRRRKKKENPPTHPVLLVNVRFYSPILTDPPMITLIWAFLGEKHPVCEKPQWLCYERCCFYFGTKLAWAEIPPARSLILPTHAWLCPCFWQGTPIVCLGPLPRLPGQVHISAVGGGR